jgi:exopolysaccharide biosynthesis protein
MAGVTKSGELILVTVDGRRPGETVGASMVEAARLMVWLGARQAINLDGGGSSAMIVKGKVVNRPSDGAERGVGDALLILP